MVVAYVVYGAASGSEKKEYDWACGSHIQETGGLGQQKETAGPPATPTTKPESLMAAGSLFGMPEMSGRVVQAPRGMEYKAACTVAQQSGGGSSKEPATRPRPVTDPD